MKKRLLSIILCLAMILSSECMTSVQFVEAAYFVEYEEERFTYQDIQILEERIDKLETQLWAAHRMADAARELGYNEGHVIIETAKADYDRIEGQRNDYIAICEDLAAHWDEKKSEYPSAAFVWNYLKDRGYSDTVAASILGNMMVEVGGLTLDLDWDMYDNRYYGICQWSREYSKVWGASLEEQCNFLEATIKYELDTYGYMYKTGYNYGSFLLSSDIREATLAFAKAYERCGSASYKQRQKCAIDAYNYFVT